MLLFRSILKIEGVVCVALLEREVTTMKSLLSILTLVLLAGLLLTPIGIFADTGQGATTQAPMSQPLVREGALAVKLVTALKLGITSDEKQAEDMLVTVGVAPRNGWIADYPVTPDIAGELRTAVDDAADGRRLTIDRDEALKTFDSIMGGYGLHISPSISEQDEGSAPSYSPDSSVINNYYYDEGPPVVTYYVPPPDYYYLYRWVPYPFWWWDFWFPGFFVLQDFDIEIHGHGHHHHDGFREHGEFVTNHFRDARTGRISRIDPARRAGGGAFADNTGSGWSTPAARSSAQAIFNRSLNSAIGTGRRVSQPGTLSGQAMQNRYVSSYGARNAVSGSHPASGRTFTHPTGGRRAFSESRAPGRTYGQSSVVSRSYASSHSGRAYSMPSSSRSFGSSSGIGRSLGSRGSFGGWRR